MPVPKPARQHLADRTAEEGWGLIARIGGGTPGYSGSADGKCHFFRDGKSLCGRFTVENLSISFIPLGAHPASSSCQHCRTKKASE